MCIANMSFLQIMQLYLSMLTYGFDVFFIIANRLLENPGLGAVVLCKYEDTRTYRRALIMKEEDGNKFKVSYLDYGN